jgi:D-glycero-alpha-D-manno-heptose 1-phosphate guanylyltransferase
MKAVILCGGLGTRLGSLTKETPKPLLEVAGQPFIAHVLNHLTRAGIDELVLAVGFQWRKLQAFVGDNWHGVPVQYSVETHPLGTGGAISAAMASASLSETLVVTGDTLFDIDIPAFLKFAKDKDAQVCVALRKVEDCSRFGRVSLAADGEMMTFGEKVEQGPGLINGGIYYLRCDALGHITSETFSFETDFLAQKHPRYTVFGLTSNAYFIDIGVPADLQRAQTELLTWGKA